jgi:hypothetical protein
MQQVFENVSREREAGNANAFAGMRIVRINLFARALRRAGQIKEKGRPTRPPYQTFAQGEDQFFLPSAAKDAR